MKTTKFQIVVLGIFVLFMAVGLLFFAAFKGKQSKSAPSLVIWGTLDGTVIDGYLQQTAAKSSSSAYSQISYVQKRTDTLYQEYVEALIAGRGPDILLLPQEELLKYKGKILQIPYANYPDKDYKATFIQEGELYETSQGIQAIPFTVDPIVMYWNRDMFSNALIATPPKKWEDVISLVPLLTKRDDSTSITTSAIGLGEYSNISHSKEILSLLLLQAGSPITYAYGNGVKSALYTNTDTISPGEQALLFYTQFADPTKKVYSWNRSLPTSKNYFVSNKLGIYLGFASEYNELRNLNPNLNFDIAVVPQISASANVTPINTTYGRMYGFSIALGAKNAGAALSAIEYLTGKATLPTWVKQTGLASVRRDALAVDSSNAATSVIATSALWSRGWIDPNAVKTSTIFKTMIEDVTSARSTAQESISNGHAQLQYLLDNQ